MNDKVVRAGNTGLPPSNTYTPSSMESRTVAASRQGSVDAGARESDDFEVGRDGLESDTGRAMSLLAAQEQERSRLAEELHDGPAQAFANAIFQVQLADRALRDDPTSGRAELEELRLMLERELDTLRGYINQLRPALDEAEGLDEALRDSAMAISQRTGVAIEVRLEASGTQLHPAARTVALRVAQEALRNIAKHSGATRVWLVTSTVDLPDEARNWVIEIGDDGRGFDLDSVAEHPNRRHFGLRFMRERAELLGSELSIQTSPAGGTVVRLSIVLAEERN